eukprot:5396691-Pleurochrysis_carterae.AAC.1
MPHVDVVQHMPPKPHVFVPPLYHPERQQLQITGNECQNITGTHAGPKLRAEEQSTTAWVLLAVLATIAAFADGQLHVLEGSNGLELPRIGIDVNMGNELAHEGDLTN